MAKTTAERLPRSLQNNQYALKLAKSVDTKNAQISKLKETEGRPARGTRAVASSIGALFAGGVAGMAQSDTARAGIGLGLGGLVAVAGGMMDSDAIFDAGMGGVYGGLFQAGVKGTGMARARFIGDAEDDEDLEDEEA